MNNEKKYEEMVIETESKYNKLKMAVLISGAAVLVVGAGMLGIKIGEIKMDKMICAGAMLENGIHKTLKDGGRIVCKYFTKEEVAKMAKEVAKEAAK